MREILRFLRPAPHVPALAGPGYAFESTVRISPRVVEAPTSEEF